MKKDQTFIQSLKGWLSGDAGLKQERELQRLAQDDPFMTDALEGYQAVPEEDHLQKLQQIRNRLAGKEEKKRGFPIWLRVAAGGAILVVALFALRWVNEGSRTQIGQATPAVQEIEEEPAATAEEVEMEEADLKQLDTEDNTTLNENVGSAVIELPETKTRKKRKALNQPKPSIANTSRRKDKENADDRLAANIEEASTKLQGNAAGVVSEEQKPVAVPSKAPIAKKSEALPAPSEKKEMARSEERVAIAEESALEEDVADSFVPPSSPTSARERFQAREITGRVTDSNGEPLIGVAVNLSGTNLGTVTNIDGIYKLPVSNQSKEVSFSYVGFQSTQLSLEKVDTYDIQLTPTNDVLSEVVITGYEDRRAKKRDKSAIQGTLTIKASGLEDVNTLGASPAGGLKKLNRMLRKNAQKIEVHYSQVGQSVSLTFRVGPGNKVEDVKVLQPKGLMLEKEAVRLIFLTQWKLKTGYLQTGATVTCRLKF